VSTRAPYVDGLDAQSDFCAVVLRAALHVRVYDGPSLSGSSMTPADDQLVSSSLRQGSGELSSRPFHLALGSLQILSLLFATLMSYVVV